MVEAARTGGALITAVKAAEYGIAVFAMPGMWTEHRRRAALHLLVGVFTGTGAVHALRCPTEGRSYWAILRRLTRSGGSANSSIQSPVLRSAT